MGVIIDVFNDLGQQRGSVVTFNIAEKIVLAQKSEKQSADIGHWSSTGILSVSSAAIRLLMWQVEGARARSQVSV